MYVKFNCTVQADKTTKYIAGTTHEVSSELGEKLVKKGLAEEMKVTKSTAASDDDEWSNNDGDSNDGDSDDGEETEASLKKKSVDELKALCSERGIDIPSGANKALLINLLLG